MLPEIKFNHKMFTALLEGRKTETRRKDPKDIVAGLYVAAVDTQDPSQRLMLRCTDKYSQKISEMSNEDAIKEGFTDLDGFKHEIASIYGADYLNSNPTMWVYEFQVIGFQVICRPATGTI